MLQPLSLRLPQQYLIAECHRQRRVLVLLGIHARFSMHLRARMSWHVAYCHEQTWRKLRISLDVMPLSRARRTLSRVTLAAYMFGNRTAWDVMSVEDI